VAIKTLFTEAATVARANLGGTSDAKALKKESKAKGPNFQPLTDALKAIDKAIKAFEKANPSTGVV